MGLDYKFVLPPTGLADANIVREMFEDVKEFVDNLTPSGSAAPVDAKYITLATNATLTEERVLTAGTGITLTDNGAGSTLVVSLTNGIGVTSIHGTTNQVTVSATTGSVTLSLPQDIATASSPTFTELLLSGGSSSADLTLKLHDSHTGFYADGVGTLTVVAGNGSNVVLGTWDSSDQSYSSVGPLVAEKHVFKSTSVLAGHPTVTIKPQLSFTSYTLTLPSDDGSANQYLTTDGSGALSWSNAAGTGTVDTGTANRLAYYPASTAEVAALSLITASRALASDANGLPVAATTTAVELGYVNGVTSAIQTQIDGKSAVAGSSSITTVGTVSAGTWSATTIAVNKGGTGQTSYTDGQLLIGNTTGNTLAKATLTGTPSQITVTNGSGTITLSLPQDIATSSTPTFAKLTESTATSDATTYTPHAFSSGGGTAANAGEILAQSTISVTTTGSTILTTTEDAYMVEVVGNDGSNFFADLLWYTFASGGGAPTVIASRNYIGSPTVRTYSLPSNSTLKLTMASGTYSIRVMAYGVGRR